MNDNLTVKEFVDKFNATTIDDVKIGLIKKIVTRNYVPVLEKQVLLKMNFDKSLMEQDGIKYIDRFLGQINLMFCILSLYTSLNLVHNKDDKETMFDDYDLLIQNEIYPLILKEIGERELQEVMNIYGSIEETFMNQQSTSAYVAKQVTRFGTLFGEVSNSGMTQLSKALENEDTMNSFIDKIKGITNKIKIVK